MRAKTETWIPQLLELFQQKGKLTSQELAEVLGKASGGDAVTRCRQAGLPLQVAGWVNGSRLPGKLYALDAPLLWLALDEAVQQIRRYALILNSLDPSAHCAIYRNPVEWIEHVRRIHNMQSKSDTP